MDFSEALKHLKSGHRLARAGWNGKNMWICLMPGYPDGIEPSASTALHFGDGKVKVRPYFAMCDSQGMMVPGWLASQTDLLADDWSIVGVSGAHV